MMSILVTGGAGFIGSAVVRLLAQVPDVNVLNFDKLTYAGNLHSLRPIAGTKNYRFMRGDVTDRLKVDAVIGSFRPTVIMHLAAESHVDRSIGGADDFIQANILGTYTMLEASRSYWEALPGQERDAFRFLHVSTDEVYGSLGSEGFFTETTRYDPSSPYAASKAASDHLARAWIRTYGLPVLISNCSNNYGPYHFPEKLIPLVILNALEGHTLPVYGDGSNVRDWLFVEDHARALWTIVRTGRPGETYNVGGRNERSNLSVVETICDVLDDVVGGSRPRRDLIAFVPDRPGHDQRYAIDATKLEMDLGWRALETFESGIRRTVQWYLDNDWWWRPIRSGIYAGERLGLVGP